MPVEIRTVQAPATIKSSVATAGTATGARRSTTSTKPATGEAGGVSLPRRRSCVPHQLSVRAFQPSRAANSAADAPLLRHDATRRPHSAAFVLVLATKHV